MSSSILNHLKVLLVEDEEKIREYIAKSLRHIVAEVKEARNGKEALECLKVFEPDIIITDLEMPVMNGVEFIKKLRISDKKTCLVVLTAHTSNEYLLELIDMHIEQFIIKPINFDKMLSVLEKCNLSIKERGDSEYIFMDYAYNIHKKQLTYKNTPIVLTKKEILFLELLFSNFNRVVTYDELQAQVWNDAIMTDSAIRSLVRNLRYKLPKDCIHNLSGVGYRLDSVE